MPQFEAKTCSLRCLLRARFQRSLFPAPLSRSPHVWDTQQPGWGTRCKIHRVQTPALLWLCKASLAREGKGELEKGKGRGAPPAY